MEKSEFNVDLRMDGKVIPLNEFVMKLIGNLIVCITKSLKNTESTWKKIEITVTKKSQKISF